jgi:hypothetical protein
MTKFLFANVLALVLCSSSFASPANCNSDELSKEAIRKCPDHCSIEEDATYRLTTQTGKDEYLVTLENAGSSFEEIYAIYTKAGTCEVENTVLVDHE